MKHYNFWVALSMAFLLLLNTVARAFHLEIDNALYNDIVMAVLGVVTVLGFVQKDGYEFTDTSKTETKTDDNQNSIADNSQNMESTKSIFDENSAENKNDQRENNEQTNEAEIILTPEVPTESISKLSNHNKKVVSNKNNNEN